MKCFLLFTSLIFFLFNVEFLPGFTISNLALVGMPLFIIYALYEGRFRGIRIDTVELVFPIVVLGSIGTLGLINEGDDLDQKLKISLSWFFLMFSFMVGWLFHQEVFSRRFVNYCGIAAIVVSLYAFTLSTFLDLRSSGLRFIINKELAGGINGYMYGLFFLQSIFLLGNTKNYCRTEWILWIFVLTLPIFAGLILGSRQYIGGMIIFAILTLLLRSKSTGNSIARVIKYILLLAVVVVPGLMIDFVRENLLDRYFYTLKQLEFGSSRFELWDEILANFHLYEIFGRGIGFTKKWAGRHPDNFYLEFIIDYGLIAFVLLTIMVVLILLKNLLIIRRYQLTNTELGLWLLVLISFVWYAQFNEIIREYALWMAFGAILSRARLINELYRNKSIKSLGSTVCKSKRSRFVHDRTTLIYSQL